MHRRVLFLAIIASLATAIVGQWIYAQDRSDHPLIKGVTDAKVRLQQGLTFDHGAFDPKTRRVFVAHTGCNSVEVIDHDSHRHVGTLHNFPEAAGVVADEGQVLVTNRGAASLAWLDGDTLETRAVFKTGHRPNGVAIVSRLRLAVVACIGDETQTAKLQALSLNGDQQSSIELPDGHDGA
jgi:DNA-binding beta-propeller fold protein YncE